MYLFANSLKLNMLAC